MEDLIKRLEKLENSSRENSRRIQNITKRLKELEERAARVKDLESLQERAEESGEKIESFQKQLYRMESTLLEEFKISQEIMRSMIEHDMSVEKAKLDLKVEVEKAEKDFLQKQKQAQLENEQARKELARNMWLKIGVIILPIATALATVLSNLLPSWFGK